MGGNAIDCMALPFVFVGTLLTMLQDRRRSLWSIVVVVGESQRAENSARWIQMKIAASNFRWGFMYQRKSLRDPKRFSLALLIFLRVCQYLFLFIRICPY